MSGYSHLSPSGHFPRSILVSFVCTCIMLCLCRASPAFLPALYAVLAAQKRHVTARIYCVRIGFLYILYMRANFVLENRTPVNNSLRLLSSSGRDVLSSKGRPTELRAVAVYTCSVDDVR